MKLIISILLVLMVAVVLISGCIQQQPETKTSQKLTPSEVEQQATNTLDSEIEQAIGHITLEDLENELFEQG
ncbi:MAG: hypothetical protein QW051_02870 [Candidatus Aenigmatarchaeota archaeon]